MGLKPHKDLEVQRNETTSSNTYPLLIIILLRVMILN